MENSLFDWSSAWKTFKEDLPHQHSPYSKRNWGDERHSLCSYQGKLKPAIAYHLVKTFVPEGGSVFDPFVGVGTIPFEASLNGRAGYGMDISVMAYYISQAKVGISSYKASHKYIYSLETYISSHSVSEKVFNKYAKFGLNKCLALYYENQTFKEILLARQFIKEQPPQTASEMVVVSALLHILHGNRPYALSRKSHPIVPYAPTGEFIYKNLIEKLTEKVDRFYKVKNTSPIGGGQIYCQDSTKEWPDQINSIDAIITSPPFYDSTRFYTANWIRLWFCGWEQEDFKTLSREYVDERQKKSFDVYIPIIQQSRERLKTGGVLVFHLGKSVKCNMGEILKDLGMKVFNHAELFSENVEHCEKFGIRDLGTVKDHQYLLLY